MPQRFFGRIKMQVFTIMKKNLGGFLSYVAPKNKKHGGNPPLPVQLRLKGRITWLKS